MDSNSTTAQQLIMAEAVEALGLREKLIEMGWVPPKEAALLMAQVARNAETDKLLQVLGAIVFEVGIPRDGDMQSIVTAIRALKAQAVDAGGGPRYTVVDKGGSYLKLGFAKPAGTIKAVQGDSGITVYRDTETGCLYFRDPQDFSRRMERISQA